MKFPIHAGVFLPICAMTMGFTSAIESNAPLNPQSLTSTICDDRTDGRDDRCEVELDVPAVCVDATSSSSCPIVFFLHGGGGNNDNFKQTSGVHDEGVIGVYPQGENGWNTGPKSSNLCDWSDFDCTTDPDEGDLIASIIAELKSRGANGNVYAIGSSNGAALAHRLAANAGSDLPIKGIVAKVTQLLASPPRSGPGILNYNQPSTSGGRTTPAVSVLSVMGTDDAVIPYDGGSSSVFGGDASFQLMPTTESMEVWATHNGCSGAQNPTITEHASNMGTGKVNKYEYTGCPDGVVVEHYKVNGGGHNAGGVTVDGVGVKALGYEFIRRIEDTIIPTPSPTTLDCVDDPSFRANGKAKRTCTWIAKKPIKRCFLDSDAEFGCPATCNASCIDCVDDPDYRQKNKPKRTCAWVAKKASKRCELDDETLEYCPATCNPICD